MNSKENEKRDVLEAIDAEALNDIDGLLWHYRAHVAEASQGGETVNAAISEADEAEAQIKKFLHMLRRALSDPAVPEAVRRLPNKIRKEVDETFENYADDWAEAQKVIGHEIADELDHALAQHGGGRGPIPEGFSIVGDNILRFLLGEAPLFGEWFHERQERERGRYWWRKFLPRPAAPEPDGREG